MTVNLNMRLFIEVSKWEGRRLDSAHLFWASSEENFII